MGIISAGFHMHSAKRTLHVYAWIKTCQNRGPLELHKCNTRHCTSTPEPFQQFPDDAHSMHQIKRGSIKDTTINILLKDIPRDRCQVSDDTPEGDVPP